MAQAEERRARRVYIYVPVGPCSRRLRKTSVNTSEGINFMP